MANRNVQLTLREAVDEVLGILTGLDLRYEPELDRFQAITRALNRALRHTALEHEWSYFSSVEEIGQAVEGQQTVDIMPSQRLRIINDDCIRLIDADGLTVVWCYFLPRDALHKYVDREGLWAAATRTTIEFSRPFLAREAGLHIYTPIMREPRMFQLPANGADVPDSILNQLIDFDYPDIVIMKAAQYIAETDAVMQPRVQTLEAHYKDLMYQLVERDDRMTDSPYENEFILPISGSLNGYNLPHNHPHADEGRYYW